MSPVKYWIFTPISRCPIAWTLPNYNIATYFGWVNDFPAPAKGCVQFYYFLAPPKGWVQFSCPTQWFWSFCTALGHQLGVTFTQMINNTTNDQLCYNLNIILLNRRPGVQFWACFVDPETTFGLFWGFEGHFGSVLGNSWSFWAYYVGIGAILGLFGDSRAFWVWFGGLSATVQHTVTMSYFKIGPVCVSVYVCLCSQGSNVCCTEPICYVTSCSVTSLNFYVGAWRHGVIWARILTKRSLCGRVRQHSQTL